MEVQSVLINKKYLTRKKAEAWIKNNKYKLKKIDITENLYRFRQQEPKLFNKSTFRMKVLKKDKNGDPLIMLVVGKKRRL